MKRGLLRLPRIAATNRGIERRALLPQPVEVDGLAIHVVCVDFPVAAYDDGRRLDERECPPAAGRAASTDLDGLDDEHGQAAVLEYLPGAELGHLTGRARRKAPMPRQNDGDDSKPTAR